MGLGIMWRDETIDLLSQNPVIGYAPDGAPATEPTALTALALIAHERKDPAQLAIEFLTSSQSTDGSVGVRQKEASPGWPTSLAVLAWVAHDRKAHSAHIDRAVSWLLEAKGKGMEQTADMGHNTQLVGWTWAENTHSWIEPTALAVLALKAVGQKSLARTREGVTLLLDRQLPAGGCNYGNTVVLGQTLRPHVQPTGISLLALTKEADQGSRLAKSIAWLGRSLSAETTAASLAWGLLGLAAHQVSLPKSNTWLEAAHRRVQAHDRSPHKLALLTLAAAGPQLLTSDLRPPTSDL